MFLSSKSKVGKFDVHSAIRDQDVLRLEIPMVNSNGVAVVDSVQNLKESTLGQEIIAHKLALLGDVGKQVTFFAEFDDNKGTVHGVQDAY